MTAPATPRDFDTLRALLLANRDRLPPRLIQVAAFALDHPSEVALGTVASVAAQAAVQPSTLIRFAKRFGYDGFSDMQGVFRSELKSTWPDYRERIARLRAEEDGDGERLLAGFVESAKASLEGAVHRVPDAEIERAATILAAADAIYVLGMRRAFPVSFYLAYALGKLGLRPVLIDHLAALAPEQLGSATKRDALIAISFTPYTPLTVELADKAAARGVPVIALTDSAFSPLAPKAAVTFEIAEADYAGFRSLAATFCVAMALAVATGAKRNGP